MADGFFIFLSATEQVKRLLQFYTFLQMSFAPFTAQESIELDVYGMHEHLELQLDLKQTSELGCVFWENKKWCKCWFGIFFGADSVVWFQVAKFIRLNAIYETLFIESGSTDLKLYMKNISSLFRNPKESHFLQPNRFFELKQKV